MTEMKTDEYDLDSAWMSFLDGGTVDLIEKRIVKRDIEGFLSAFNYNTYGATNIDEISNLVFTGDDDIPDKLAERKRANPPPIDVNAGILTGDIVA